jgi:hypothetical protein
VHPTESARAVAEAIDQAEARIRQAVPEAAYIFIEPDIRRWTDPEAKPQGPAQQAT